MLSRTKNSLTFILLLVSSKQASSKASFFVNHTHFEERKLRFIFQFLALAYSLCVRAPHTLTEGAFWILKLELEEEEDEKWQLLYYIYPSTMADAFAVSTSRLLD